VCRRPQIGVLIEFCIIIVLFVETPRKFITAKLSIRKPFFSEFCIVSNKICKQNTRVSRTDLTAT
jgi:hypothetical protein